MTVRLIEEIRREMGSDSGLQNNGFLLRRFILPYVDQLDTALDNLPTSDPAVAGQLWNDNGELAVSAG